MEHRETPLGAKPESRDDQPENHQLKGLLIYCRRNETKKAICHKKVDVIMIIENHHKSLNICLTLTSCLLRTGASRQKC